MAEPADLRVVVVGMRAQSVTEDRRDLRFAPYRRAGGSLVFSAWPMARPKLRPGALWPPPYEAYAHSRVRWRRDPAARVHGDAFDDPDEAEVATDDAY